MRNFSIPWIFYIRNSLKTNVFLVILKKLQYLRTFLLYRMVEATYFRAVPTETLDAV